MGTLIVKSAGYANIFYANSNPDGNDKNISEWERLDITGTIDSSSQNHLVLNTAATSVSSDYKSLKLVLRGIEEVQDGSETCLKFGNTTSRDDGAANYSFSAGWVWSGTASVASRYGSSAGNDNRIALLGAQSNEANEGLFGEVIITTWNTAAQYTLVRSVCVAGDITGGSKWTQSGGYWANTTESVGAVWLTTLNTGIDGGSYAWYGRRT